ncbi:MAG: CHAT domain-containing protein, partial [Planctomycetales bacterium]
LAKKLAVTTELSGRETYTVLGNLLRDPQPADWLSNPLEALSVLVTPHPEVYEMWFDVANSSVLKRKEAAFQIADLTRRHRFYSTLQFGGRLLSLRWVLEAPEASISKAALLQRQELLAQFPQYAALQQQTARFQEQLAKLPLAPKEPDVLDQQKQLLASLAAARGGQEAILRLMAVRRYPSAMIFPPRRTVKEVQEGLANDSAALVFFYSAFRRHFYAYVISKTEFADFEVGSYDAIRPKLEALLRDMGHQDKNKALSLKILKDPQWRKSSKDLLTQLFRNGGGLPTDVQELAIVPDGLLWYVPFEALGASAAPGLNSWISRVRIRYAPTAGLIHGDRRGQPRNPSTAVLLGQLYPRDSAQVAEQAYPEFSRSVSGSQRIHRDEPLAGPSSLFKGMFDRLIVFDEIDPPSAGAYSWVPMAGRNHSGGTLDSWLGLPWKGPDAAIFPAFHSRAEDAGNLSGLNPNVAGNELFLSVCGLMASGSRTIVLSRWRTGGYTSYELIREFTQELGRSSPAEAWQRSVFLASETQIRPDAEPRIDVPPNVEPPNASHPFFWSGYLLVDSSQPAQAADEAGGQPNSKQEEKRRILERINQDLENKK